MENTKEQTQQQQPTSNLKSYVRLDDGAIAAAIQSYPPEAREASQWLAAFVREKCNRNLNVLEARVKKLGFQTGYTTFYKILTGSYFVELGGGKRAGSVANFLQVVDALRKEDRIAWRAGRIPFVETTTWDSISAYVDKKRQPERVCKFGLIVGMTGMQKSACYKEYVIRNNHGRCSHLESPERPRMGQFINDLAQCIGVPRSQSHTRKLNAISSAINEQKCLIIDNVQHFYRPDAGGDQPVFNFLQKLQDDTGCTIILSCTPEFPLALERGAESGYFEQFIGRMGGLNKALYLPEYPPRADILAIADSFGLVDAKKHVAYLEKLTRSKGRIRILFDDLQDAKQLAQEDNQPLTIDHVKLARGEQ